jgi:hypothetical protein
VKQQKSIQKILTSNQKPFQIGLAMLGCLIGFFLILVSVQSIINFRYLFNESSQGIGSQFMVINKKVGLLNSFNIGKTTFSEEEIESIATQPSIQKISAFVGNKFEAEAFLELNNGSNQARLKTDLFLESVQDAFIDVDLQKWEWDTQSDEIPVILPSDFINLYNFTYAPSRNLPQISKNTVKLFGFSIIIRGNNAEKTYKGNIIGFSDRISSMLVPISFMNFANQKYGLPALQKEKSSYRIIAAVKPEQLNGFETFLAENNYETNQELLRNGKFIGIMYLLISIIFIIGIIISFNAFTGFILYFHLLIYRSRNEIDSLLRLGYPHSKLVKNYLSRIVIIVSSLFSFAIICLLISQHYIAGLLLKYTVEIPNQIHYYSVISLSAVAISLIMLFFFQIRTEIYQIALPPKNGSR